MLIPSRGPPALLIDGQQRPFDDRAFEACIARSLGYTMGYDEATRAKSTAAAISFLERNMTP